MFRFRLPSRMRFIRVKATDYYLYAWVNGACGDAADTSTFTKDTCFSRTYYNYKQKSESRFFACDNNDEIGNSLNLGAFILLTLIA
ncbi:unnamed protein product [Paramecium octaurelia]|uniref:Uncharacterized protein n=1 Tax=Paramecium octaurelia TaxID=43137 RepID=A0A8S1W808_PAROT|nr:unnamed protein product [Paramecium octaurelia]